MTGRRAYPMAGIALAVDELYAPSSPTTAELLTLTTAASPSVPSGAARGAGPLEVVLAAHPAGITTSPLFPDSGSGRVDGHGFVDGEGVASWVSVATPNPHREDTDDTWVEIVTGVRPPRSATSHHGYRRVR